MLRKLFHILAAASVLVGCNTALLDNTGEVGYLAVDFSCDDSTKAAEIDLSGYSVSIKGQTLDFSLESTCGELPAVLELVPGDYEISVSSPNEASAVFDTPIYSSFEEFTIVTDVTLSLSMVLKNVQVTFLTSPTFDSSTVESCSVTVSNGEDSLTWALTDIENNRSGYFMSASVLYISLEGMAKNGNPLKYDDVISDVMLSEHYRITLGEYVPVI